MNNFNKERLNIVSLMGRMENRHTLTEAVEYQNELLLEDSRRVSDRTFMEFLTHYNIHKNRFLTLAYIQLYPTGSVYPTDDNFNTMDSAKDDEAFGPENQRGLNRYTDFMDKVKNTEWSAPTGRAYNGQRAMGKKLYPYVIKLTKYRMNWQPFAKYKENAHNAYKGIGDLENQMDDTTWSTLVRHNNTVDNNGDKVSYGYYPMGIEGNYDILTYGSKDKDGNYSPIEQKYLDDPDDLTSGKSYLKKAIRHYLNDVKAQKPVYFGVDENGYIDPIPKSIGKILHNTEDKPKDLTSITDPQQMAIAKEYLNAVKDNSMRDKTFMLDNVAYMCCTVTESGAGEKESVYWVNPQPLFLLEKSKTVNKVRTSYKYAFKNLNNEELESIMDRLAHNDSDELLSLSNDNTKGNTMYADDKKTK